ncbi:hypothetical protein D5018_06365 [Parashewanella curva]|uniref:CHAD domain-containing protein n=1 Tax=Parashewanella curva TaxID=2338552 RepID=A0A3L8Q0L0_9GAMM|nr:hypothetical protein [Parashewanella curva]RLV60569.1 hypothetical protein D5018_06365 [Parashewanella curva]
MAGMLRQAILIMSIGLSLLVLTGCGDDRPEQIQHYQKLTDNRLATLAQELRNGQLRNAELLKQYSAILAKQKPQYTALLQQLAKDATDQGPIFKGLTRRLSESKDSANFIDLDAQLAEIENLYQAAAPSLYNDMLSDPVNVIADMSGGTLARVNSISRQADLMANNASDFGAGSQLVGNPSYGQWQTGSNGISFWEWYGMYALFSNLASPVRYDSWSRHRGYSYYGDVGRYRYTSPKQMKKQQSVYQKTQSKFKRQGKSFTSPYAKTRTGSTSLSRASQVSASTKSSSSKFRSNYSKSSNFRNSSSRTSRGISRGK